MSKQQLSFGNNNIKINITNNNKKKNKRVHSVNYRNHSSNKRKRNIYNFRENTFSDNDVNIKSKNDKNNLNDIKKKSLSNNNKNNNENYLSDNYIDELVKEKDKKIQLIIDDYIQQTEAEIQLKQKIINIQYNLILLYNKIQKNLSFKKNNSVDKIKLKNLKKMLEKSIETLNEIAERNENFIKKYIENNNKEEDIEFNFLQKKYIYVVFKNTKKQKENIEIKFKYTILKNENEKKDNYIKELEKQIKLRDFIIKELLCFDYISKNNINQEKNEIKNNIKNILLNILKKEKNIHYLTLSQLKSQNNIFTLKNKNQTEQEININRPNTICEDYKLDNYFDQNTNNSNKEYFQEKEDYIIDFDKDKSQVNNTYINLRIPSLIKSNSSFNINKLDLKIYKYKLNKTDNDNKKEIESEKNFNRFPYKKYLNEDYNGCINNKITELEKNNKEENSNLIKSILSKIKSTNNEISSKMNIIEQQTNRNKKIIGITGQVSNKKLEKTNTAYLFNNKFKEDRLLKLSQNNLKLNITREQPGLKKILLENLNKENNDANYTIDLQMINKKITNRKCKEKSNNKTKIFKSENNKNKNPKIVNYDKIDTNSTLRKIELSKEQSDNKPSNQNKRIKHSKIMENLTQTKSFISISKQEDIHHKNKNEKNKSAKNIIINKKGKMILNKNNNEYYKNNYNINIRIIKDNMNHKKYNTMFIATNFNDKNSVYIQNKTFLNKKNKEKKGKNGKFINPNQ